MEDLKLAFETVIVGLLTIPWLLLLFHVLLNWVAGVNLFDKVRKLLNAEHKSLGVVGMLIIGLAYCAGTIIFPFADEYFNDQHYFPVSVTDDDSTRVDTFTDLLFKHQYYKLNPPDFTGLPDAEENIEVINSLGPLLPKISNSGDWRKKVEEDLLKNSVSEKNRKIVTEWISSLTEPPNGCEQKCPPKVCDWECARADLHERLKNPVHSIYNYQKFHDYDSAHGYEILKPLSSRIIVLRGAVWNGIVLFYIISIIFLIALVEALIFRRLKERLPGLVILLLVTMLVWWLCQKGSNGVTYAENEYDKHVVGLFYGERQEHDVSPSSPIPSPGAKPSPSR